jgi:hypothetical protein
MLKDWVKVLAFSKNAKEKEGYFNVRTAPASDSSLLPLTLRPPLYANAYRGGVKLREHSSIINDTF